MLLPTTLVGSYPQPEWLIDRKRLAGRFPPRVRAKELWRVAPELLAEAYVMGVGRYLAGFDDRTFDALRERIVTDENGLPEGQWTWVTSQRNVLS